MLSESSAAVVAATLPVVRAHGEEITGRFYPRMFTAHPELLNLFNRGNRIRVSVMGADRDNSVLPEYPDAELGVMLGGQDGSRVLLPVATLPFR